MPLWKSRLLLLTIVILVASVVTITLIFRQRLFAPDRMQQASAALRRGDWDAAISALRSEIDLNPDSTAAKLRIATLLKDSSPEDAIAYLQRIPPADPQRENAIQQIAVLGILHQKTAEAESALLELAARHPESLGPQLSLAELYFQSHKLSVALAYAINAARIAPDRAQTFLLIAEIHDEMRHPEMMIEPLQAAIRLEPDLYEARLNLAYAFNKTGQPSQSEEQASWCLRTHPRDVFALRILASAARDLGRFADAEQNLKAALKIEPDNLDCRILEADLLLYRRQPQEAYERLKQLYNSQQQTVRYLGALARAAASAGHREESRQLHQRVAELLRPQPAEDKTTP